jgi:hypothetical protein
MSIMIRTATCRECGKPFTVPARGKRKVFCMVPCEKRFNNRRMRRGALIYDMFMEGRFNRAESEKTMRSVMSRIAMRFRDEDKAEREGRVSWGEVGDKISVVDKTVGVSHESKMTIGRKRL